MAVPRLRGHLPKSAWEQVDWSRPDGELAALLGVTPQAVAGQRHSRGKGSSRLTHPAQLFRRWVAANEAALHGLSSRAVAERFAAETGVVVPQSTAMKGLRAAGVPAYQTPKGTRQGPPSKLARADWRLPTQDLAEVWGVTQKTVSLTRRNVGIRALWRAGRVPGEDAAAYRKALAAERVKAAKVEGN